MNRGFYFSILIIALVLSSSAPAFTGVNSEALSGISLPGKASLLDPSKLSMCNSLFFGYASGGGQKQGMGALSPTLGYSFTSTLFVRATVSKEYSFFGRESSDSGISLSGLEMSWMPSKNLHIQLEFGSVPFRRYSDSWYVR